MAKRAANQQTKIMEGAKAAPPQPAAAIQVKRILVPIDFSGCSRKALQYALTFGEQFRAELTVVHVVPNISAESRLAFDMPELQRALVQEGQEKLQAELESCSAAATVMKPSIKRGVPFQVIVELAQQLKVDLIVIGTHGRTGLKHVFMGSTAERVVRHAPCPVLVVREREHEFCLPSQAKKSK